MKERNSKRLPRRSHLFGYNSSHEELSSRSSTVRVLNLARTMKKINFGATLSLNESGKSRKLFQNMKGKKIFSVSQVSVF